MLAWMGRISQHGGPSARLVLAQPPWPNILTWHPTIPGQVRALIRKVRSCYAGRLMCNSSVEAIEHGGGDTRLVNDDVIICLDR
jgi:hypothetical protein